MSSMNRPSVHLIGGGWDPEYASAVYGPFLTAAAAAEPGSPDGPEVACVVLDEGDGPDQFTRWAEVLVKVAPCRPRPVLVPIGGVFDPIDLGTAHGLLVCGGLTPGYAAALAPAGPQIVSWLVTGNRPYAGFSAGSAVAPSLALVGGWLSGGVPVCPEDSAEDLAELSLRPGLGLVRFTVDVHCAQWGTLPRLIEAVSTAPDQLGVGIDENTVLIVDPNLGTGLGTVSGKGTVWRVARTGTGSSVAAYRSGETVPLQQLSSG
jgi:cyanophycinase